MTGRPAGSGHAMTAAIKDCSGAPVRAGALLVDERGRVWGVQDTDSSTEAQGLALVVQLRFSRWRGQWVPAGGGISTFIRANQCFVVVEDDLGSTKHNEALWLEKSLDRVAQDARWRRQHAD